MINEELLKFQILSKQLYLHKYRYYILNNPIITDQEYDLMEFRYVKMAKNMGIEPEIANMIGFNRNHPYYNELGLTE